MKSLIDPTLTESKAHDLFLNAYNYAKQKNDPELINFQTGLLLAEIEENQMILSENMNLLLNDKKLNK